MIPIQTFDSYPIFGDNATKAAPDAQKYSSGFIQADVLPAEWMNWAWSHNTKGITDLNKGVSSIETELNAVVTAGGATPAEETGDQVLTAINYLINQAKAAAILAAHPVGSLYWSLEATDPTELFGGTWARIKDTFVMAAGDTYPISGNGSKGGSATATLATDNLPSHNHSFTGLAVTSGGSSAASTGSESSHTHTVGAHSHGLNSHTHTVTASGSISGGSYSFSGTAGTTGYESAHESYSGNVSGGSYSFSGSTTSTASNGSHYHFYCADDGAGSESSSRPSNYGLYPRVINYVPNENINGSDIYSSYNNSWSEINAYYPITSSNYNNRVRLTVDGEGAGHWTSTKSYDFYTAYQFPTCWSGYHNHSFTPYGSVSVTSNPSYSGTCYGDHYHGFTPSGSVSVTNNPTFKGSSVTSGAASGSTANSDAFNSGAGSSHSHTMAHTHSVTAAGTIGNTGNGSAFSILPPYQTAYCWKRTA